MALSDIFSGETPATPEPQAAAAPVVQPLSSVFAPQNEVAQEKTNQAYGDPFVKNIAAGAFGTVAGSLRAIPEFFQGLKKDHPEITQRYFVAPAERLEAEARSLRGEGIVPETLQGVGSTIASIPLAPLAMYHETFNAAKEGGATDEQAKTAALPGFAVNTALEWVGIGRGIQGARAMARITSPGLRKAAQFAYEILTSSAVEGLTESAQEVVNNLVRTNYNAATDGFNLTGALDGAARAGLLGATSSAALFGTTGVVAHVSQQTETTPSVIPDPTPHDVHVEMEKRQGTQSLPVETSLAKVPTEEAVPARGAIDSVSESSQLSPAAHFKTAQAFVDYWSTPLLDVVARNGEQGASLAASGRRATDAAKGYIALWQEPITEFQKTIAGRTPEQRAIYKELKQIDREGTWGETVFQKAVENDEALARLSPGAREVVQHFRYLVRMVADSAVNEGVQIELPDGSTIPFSGEPEGRRLVRNFTPEAWQIIEAGPHDRAYGDLANALAEMNGLDEPVALRELNAMRERTLNRRAPFEVARSLKRFPSHLFVRGQAIPLLHADPFSASQSMLRSQALRLGYIHEFGQNPGVAEGHVQAAQQEAGRYGAERAENLLRALQGIPVDKPSAFFPPGSSAHQMLRSLRLMLGLSRTGLLTTSAIPNLFETVNTVPATTGFSRYMKAFAHLLKEPGIDPRLRLSRDMARTIDVLNWNWDRERSLESLQRIASNMGQTLFLSKGVNELNEIVNAQAALDMAHDLKSGKGTLSDRLRLEFMKFDEHDIKQLMSGEASRDVYQALIQRVVETGQATTSVPAERSRAASSRTWNFWVPFDSYSQKTFNRTYRLFQETAENIRGAIEAKGSKASLKRVGASTGRLAGWLGGAGLAGTFAVFTRAMMYNGLVGGLSRWEEAKDDLNGFFVDNMAYVLLGGASEIAFNALSQDEIGKGVIEGLLPVRTAQEVRDVVKSVLKGGEGTGNYEGYDGIDLFTHILERNVTAFRPLRSWAAVMGLGTRDRELEVAIARYYSWTKKNVGFTETSFRPPTDPQGNEAATRKFRTAMKAAEKAIRAGESQGQIVAKLKKAVGGGDIAASLAGRRLLTRIPVALREKFAQDIPPEQLQKLIAYDELLKTWSEEVK